VTVRNPRLYEMELVDKYIMNWNAKGMQSLCKFANEKGTRVRPKEGHEQ
jgi:hypothetical protein